ncbi:Uncharacterised protein [Mycobacteroides abscessus subsp. abscessus]|nr:Uncharacterised protein [Mycobacteroides abscessus subsp. abscessus]
MIVSSFGVSPHQRGLRLNTIRCWARSISVTMNGPPETRGASRSRFSNASGVSFVAFGYSGLNNPCHSA